MSLFKPRGPDQIGNCCVEHSMFRCSECAFKEIDSLRAELDEYKTALNDARTHNYESHVAGLVSELKRVQDAFKKEKSVELFEDGVEADAADMSKAECYATGRQEVLGAWEKAIAPAEAR